MSDFIRLINELCVIIPKNMKKITLLILAFLISTNYVISQENKISTSEMIINSTIRIECTGDTIINNQKQNFTSTGTGFFLNF
jgi:hypothetical protein